MTSTTWSLLLCMPVVLGLGCSHQPQVPEVPSVPNEECRDGVVSPAPSGTSHQIPRSMEWTDLVQRYRERQDVAVARVRVDKVEPVWIRRGLLGLVKSEHLVATVVEVVSKGAGFEHDVPRRMLKEGRTIDLVNKPGSDRSGGILGIAKQPDPKAGGAGVPIGTMVEGAVVCVVIAQPGRNGFLVVDAIGQR